MVLQIDFQKDSKKHMFIKSIFSDPYHYITVINDNDFLGSILQG